jgi:hypothetical protein
MKMEKPEPKLVEPVPDIGTTEPGPNTWFPDQLLVFVVVRLAAVSDVQRSESRMRGFI